jgi:hypothetical protein
MAQTLFDATLRVARNLGTAIDGQASAAGTTVTLVDTVKRTEVDDYWIGGTLWLTYDAGAEDAAPQGEYSNISDSTAAGTITISDAFTAATADNDRYTIGKKRYDIYRLIQNVNQALVDMGPIEYTDTTSLDTASSQTEYTLPAAANRDLRQVWIQGRTSDSDDNRWHKIYGWGKQKTATGTADELILPFQYTSGRGLKLVYTAEHAALALSSDKIDESCHLDRVVIEATVRCLMWRKSRVGDADPSLDTQIAFWTNPIPGIGLSRLERARLDYPIILPKKDPSMVILADATWDKNNLATPTV